MSDIFFSIVVPTYNRAHLISRTIRSVTGQLFTNWELIVVDDGSTDDTKSVVKGFADARIKYHWQNNQERSMARNNGIKLATGRYICLLDSDDIWRSNHLQVLYNAIEEYKGRPAVYFTGMCWNFSDRTQDVIFDAPGNETMVEYVIRNQVAPSTTCFSPGILQQYSFSPKLRINEDVELFARIAAVYPFIRVPVITVDFMVHNQNTRAQEKNYITPQIQAMRLIFNYPELKDKISPAFKKEVFKNLSHQLINHYSQTGEWSKMNAEIVPFLLKHPLDSQNKSRLVLLLYHLPGGGILKKIVAGIKGK